MAKLKFGSPAWRKKYMKTNKPKRKAAQRKPARRTRTAKRKRLKEMIRGNPPSSWTNVKAFRVVKKNGRAVLEVRK
jgi:hypothetical protein